MAHFGYKRVSTTQQVTDRQLVGYELDEVYEDKLSGKNADRPQLQALLSTVRKGDTIYVDSLDRLGRNLSDILAIVQQLRDKSVTLVSKKENIDTSKTDPVSKAMVAMFGTFAELERDMMLTRQREAMEAARANGTWKPRGKGKNIDRDGIVKALQNGMSLRKTAALFGVGVSTVQRVQTEQKAV